MNIHFIVISIMGD